ncbi:membrane protein [Fulvitalea axinellae]|uniref:Membrane protein n=1 Tax=Fulvitalea axinellae TaxID=1182444 RepID=A0AAU9CPV0_9BACT|nr:membrane protein [Fulvitalea axinellae]
MKNHVLVYLYAAYVALKTSCGGSGFWRGARLSVKLSIVVLFLTLSNLAEAQQDPMFTQYLNNSVLQNPAYAGSNNTIQGMLLYRSQWMGFEGAPQTTAASFNMPWVKYGIGIGGSMYVDEIGPERELFTAMDFSYRIKLGESEEKVWVPIRKTYDYLMKQREQKFTTYLSFGLKMSFSDYKVLLDPEDATQPGDAELFNDINRRALNVGFGLYLYSPKYYVSFAIPQLLGHDFLDGEQTTRKKSFDELYYYLSGGYVFSLNPYVKFKPTTMIRYVQGAPLSVDVNANFLFLERFWAGLGYRLGDALLGNMEYRITDHFSVGYSYDMTTTSLAQYSSGTHEITLKFDFLIKTLAPCKPYF